MAMFANTKAFLSPRVSGLGRVLQHRTDDEATGGTAAVRRRGNRVKEA
jgi:preprotein translocase subunit SecD